ncbi:unnamed protein product [Sphagnum jensenii]
MIAGQRRMWRLTDSPYAQGLVRTSERSTRHTTEIEEGRRESTTRDGAGESSCLRKALALGSEEEFNSLSAQLLSAALGVKLQKILLVLENRQ